MAGFICQVIKLSVSRSFKIQGSTALSTLNASARQLGALETFAGKELHKPGTLFFVATWPRDKVVTESPTTGQSDLVKEIRDLSTDQELEIWSIPVKTLDNLRKALLAPVFQFCCVWLRKDVDPKTLAEPTFTDCYEAPGFTGGDWGADIHSEGRMNWYCLGWESRKLHDEYMASDLFWVEVNKLQPHMEQGFASFIYLKSVE